MRIPDLLSRKRTSFVLWRPGATDPLPALYIGRNPGDCGQFREIPLWQNERFPELWELAAAECGLTEGQVYFYWFKARDTDPYREDHPVLYCTDPTAWTVDRRFKAELTGDPPAVALYRNGALWPCDPGGETVEWVDDAPLSSLPLNNRLVIYELPARWSRTAASGSVEVGNGTFQDVLALLRPEVRAPDFPGVAALENRAHLVELGVNALELLPPADSDDKLEWGYGTANFFAADFDLGHPSGSTSPTASVDLARVIQSCHQLGIRFFYDAVMAFSRNNPYHNVNYLDFYVQRGSGDPEQGSRDGFGGDLFKYNYWTEGYHPVRGDRASLVPAREYMKTAIAHWMDFYRIDGLRLDSVNNVANYDFLQELKDYARALWQSRGGSPDRFLVVGEELSVPLDLIRQKRLDGLWNEKFKQIARQVLLGRSWPAAPDFAASLRALIDCRQLGFEDGAQAVNYLGSHDVGGSGNERLYNYLLANGVRDVERRIKLGFACLLTAVGIPLILAGDEFADQQDLGTGDEHGPAKQVDPVNFGRLADPWRKQVFDYVARLVRLRTASPALAVNDTEFIHFDFEEGKQVIAWQRGRGEDLVVVVANFSDWESPGAEYRIASWPAAPLGKVWREITQDRYVPSGWVGREPLYPWQAKVYAMV